MQDKRVVLFWQQDSRLPYWMLGNNGLVKDKRAFDRFLVKNNKK
jgi:hypothetical protein